MKTFAVGALMVAAALPALAMSGTASAATTAPAFVCATAALTPTTCTGVGYAVVGQGFSGDFQATGTNFADDQAVGGNVTLTTTASGVTFTDVVETSATNLTADLDTSSTTAPGFYPVTLTDDNGTTTFTVGLGVDNGPQVTTISGNAGTVGSNATVTITGTGLAGAAPSFVPVAGNTAPTISGVTSNNAGTSLSFTADNAGATPGSWGLLISSEQGGEAVTAPGVATSSYTVNAATTAVSITGVSPNELGIPVTNPSTVTVTISGTGFELGAILTITPNPADANVSIADPTFVNSTTMTAQVTVDPTATVGELNVAIVNPDTTNVSGAGLIGIGEPATSTAAGPAAPVAPALGAVTGFLAPGTASIIKVTGTSTFPITTGSTVNVKQNGVTNTSESLEGTVVSVDSTNDATIRVEVPRYATTVTTAAAVAGATTVLLSDDSGIATSGNATIVDGASSEKVAYTLSGNTMTVTTVGGLAFAHAAGVTVEFPYPATNAGIANVLTIGNGTNTETSQVLVETGNPAPAFYPFDTYTATNTGATLATLDPGTYSINAYLPGFGFVAGSTVTFQSFTTGGVADNDGVTGTVALINGNTATLAVTVPKIRSGATGDYLAAAGLAGQNAITLNSVVNHSVAGDPNIAVGDSLTINADAAYTVPETVTVTSVNATTGVVGITPALADNHTGGAAATASDATVTDNSDPQSINDRVQATITNGAGVVEIDPNFFSFTTGGTITSTQLAASVNGSGLGVAPLGASNTVGAGAESAVLNLALSQPTDGSAVADWSGSSTNTGVTFGAITNDTGSNLTTTISVAPGTAAAASVPISFTDGLETYAGTIAIVAGPTVSAVTAVDNLTAPASGPENSITFGVTGTNFVVGEMSCTTSDAAIDAAGNCVVDTEPTDSSTTATVTIFDDPAMLNGTDSLTMTYSGGAAATYGSGTLATAFTVSGQPTVTSVAPTTIAAGGPVPSVATPIVVTGTLFSAAPTVCTVVATHPDTTTTTGTCTVTDVSATTADITGLTYTGYGVGSGGDSVVFTFGTTESVASTQAVSVQTDPFSNFMINSGVLQNYTHDGSVAAGSTAVPFYIIGGGYLAGATVTFSTVPSGGTPATATVTSVTPNGIYGTVNVPASTTVDPENATVTNANGGAGTLIPAFTVTAAPSVTSPSTGTPKAILDGTATSLTITGTGFITGATVAGAVTGVDTFGTAVVSNSANALDTCTGLAGDTCNTITVPITPVSFSGATPILDGLVITNPVGGGSVTVNNDITVNPVPAVTGVYYVPTFTSNVEVTINGSGFESGITASSANPDYTVLAVASTPTTVTLLVSTDSNATAGTSSVITLTNPDTGSGTFTLNGGPNPKLATPTPKATKVNGVVHVGKKTKVTVSGTHFYGQPKVTSNDPGTKVQVTGDSGKLLTMWVTTKSTTKTGVHTFTIRFANGETTSVKYSTTK